MTSWKGTVASLLALAWWGILRGVLVVILGAVSPIWLPPPLERAREGLKRWRKRLPSPDDNANCDEDHADSNQNDFNNDNSYNNSNGGGRGRRDKSTKMTDRASAAAAAAAEGSPDLGRRYLDFIAHALEQGREAAAASAASAAAVAAAAAAAAATPAESRQRDGFSPTLNGGGLPESFIDVSVYDEVVLTTDWEASGIMAVGMTFAAFTAEARRAAAAAPASGGTQRPYPLRTVVVGEGITDGKVLLAKKGIAAIRQTGLVPLGCEVDVIEGSASGQGRVQPRTEVGQAEQREGARWETFGVSVPGFCSGLFGSLLRSIFRRWGGEVTEGGGGDLARARLREVFAKCRRKRQRVLVIALKPPRDLVKVLEDDQKAGWWGGGAGGGEGRGDRLFGHVDLLISGGFSGVFSEQDVVLEQPRRRGNTSVEEGHKGGLVQADVEQLMRKVNRVFIVQLDDLVGSDGFPKAITTDRTPTLSAAMAGARGVLPHCLRRVVATSNLEALTGFPDKVASAISAGRYANEELRVTASAIAVAVIGAMGGGRGRVAELGACMADLIASDFENLELAGLSPGTQQAVFRSLNVGMTLSDVAVAWALVCQDAVCWQRCSRVGIDASAGRIVPLDHHRGRGGGAGAGCDRHNGQGAESGGYNHGGEDVDDSEDGGDRRVGFFKRRKGDARECTGEAGMSAGTKSGGCDGFPNSSGGVFMATGFAEGRTRLEDQEVGYAAFAAFLVRALDQMP